MIIAQKHAATFLSCLYTSDVIYDSISSAQQWLHHLAATWTEYK